jgi:hypothetical protein
LFTHYSLYPITLPPHIEYGGRCCVIRHTHRDIKRDIYNLSLSQHFYSLDILSTPIRPYPHSFGLHSHLSFDRGVHTHTHILSLFNRESVSECVDHDPRNLCSNPFVRPEISPFCSSSSPVIRSSTAFVHPSFTRGIQWFTHQSHRPIDCRVERRACRPIKKCTLK